MRETIELGELSIVVTRKHVKRVQLCVHPPEGRITLVAPVSTRLEVARAYAISKLPWIRSQRAQLQAQARESPRRYLTRETHYVWGCPHLLDVIERDAKPSVELSPKRLLLVVRPGSDQGQRERVVHEWHKRQLHAVIPDLLDKWVPRLSVERPGYVLQRMITKWGSCNPAAGRIRLNTELIKKPKDLLEYVIVHELAHLIEPNHGERFVALLDRHYPGWREARACLNALPLSRI